VSAGGRPPALRAVLLGASNLAHSFPHILAHVRRRSGGPVEVLGAFGSARSYGEWSRLFWVRGLPGIVGCGLWRELAAREPLPTVALLTDVGNDLAYGESVERIASWVETCLGRLAAARAATVLTLLPLASLERVPPWRFHLARALLFPGRAIERQALLDRARELDLVLRRLAREAGAAVVEPDPAWYGIDLIHIKRKVAERAWGEILGRWPEGEGGGEGGGGEMTEKLRGVRRLRAAELRLGPWTVRTAQPCGRLRDGTTVELY
jgi:hypothetical protein